DVIHLILTRGDKMEWTRLVKRFARHERVLLSHLILYGYAYPSEKSQIPAWVTEQLLDALKHERPSSDKVCYGTNVAQKGFGTALREWGLVDGRLKPHGPLDPDELKQLPEP